MNLFSVYKVYELENKEIVIHKPPSTTGEFPIESFVQIRVELKLQIEQKIDTNNCPPNSTCPMLVLDFPKTMVSSGVIIWSGENKTLILTAGHSCENEIPEPIKLVEEKIRVKTGYGISSTATVLQINREEDLCMLGVEEYLGPPMKYSNKTIPLHTEVFAMASPLGLGSPYAIPVFEGRYFGDVGSEFSTYGFPSAPGSSGGPIFTKDGRVVGIITAVANGFHHFSIATTAKQTSIFLDKNIKLFNNSSRIQDPQID